MKKILIPVAIIASLFFFLGLGTTKQNAIVEIDTLRPLMDRFVDDAYNARKAYRKVPTKEREETLYNAAKKVDDLMKINEKLGQLFEEEKYSKIVEVIHNLHKKYDIDTKAALDISKNTLALRPDGGKGDGECSVATAGVINMAFQLKMIGKSNASYSSAALNSIIQKYLTTDPNKVCLAIKDEANKYGISYEELKEKSIQLMKARGVSQGIE